MENYINGIVYCEHCGRWEEAPGCAGIYAGIKEVKVYNGTPHPINILDPSCFKKDEAIRKLVSDSPVTAVTYPSNGMLNAKFTEVVVDLGIAGVKTCQKQVVSIDPLPDGYDFYIVSALYASAAAIMGYDTGKMLTVSNPVYSPDGRTILGCEGLMLSKIVGSRN